MFTDIITVDAERKIIIIHIFDQSSGNFTQKIALQPTTCSKIYAVQVGRTAKTLRLFVTCDDTATKRTVVRMFDRDMNNELAEL